jgi:hypothetical protein
MDSPLLDHWQLDGQVVYEKQLQGCHGTTI